LNHPLTRNGGKGGLETSIHFAKKEKGGKKKKTNNIVKKSGTKKPKLKR